MSLPFDLDHAVETLASADERLAAVMRAVGPCRLELRPIDSPFEALLRAIVFQQLSTKAASTIYNRVLELFPDRSPDPQLILDISDDTLRGAGMSRAKIASANDLSARTMNGSVPDLKAIEGMENDEIISKLSEIRGTGRWTVEMMLIFSLGRPDVLPSTDLGVRKGFRDAYGRESLPAFKELEAFGERWRPYRSVASWYLWRVVDSDNTEW